MVEKGDDGSLTRCPNLFRMVCTLALLFRCMLVGGLARNDFDRTLYNSSVTYWLGHICSYRFPSPLVLGNLDLAHAASAYCFP